MCPVRYILVLQHFFVRFQAFSQMILVLRQAVCGDQLPPGLVVQNHGVLFADFHFANILHG